MSEEYIHQYGDMVETVIALRKKDKEIIKLKQAIHGMSKMIYKLEMNVMRNNPSNNKIHGEIDLLFESHSIQRVI